MRLSPRRFPALMIAAAPLLLAGCMYYPYGSDSAGLDDGYYGSSGYYGGVSLGSGWYDDYYYPGSGYYVYDRAGARHRMREEDRRRWLERREARREDRIERREDRAERREDRIERRREREANLTPEQVQRREVRREARREERREARQDGGGVFNREARQAVRNAVRSRGAQTGTAPVRDH